MTNILEKQCYKCKMYFRITLKKILNVKIFYNK